MTLLTPHFAREEFERDGTMPDECVPLYTKLCETLLEPLRIHFGLSVSITSGYRSVAANAAAHGVPASQHVATANHCAADFKFVGMDDMRAAFDWLRSQPHLQWDEAILEHEHWSVAGEADIIHLSLTNARCRRMALEGATANRTAYTHHDVVPFAEVEESA